MNMHVSMRTSNRVRVLVLLVLSLIVLMGLILSTEKNDIINDVSKFTVPPNTNVVSPANVNYSSTTEQFTGSCSILPDDIVVFIITPTYTRLTQKVDLIRLGGQLRQFPYIRWIIIEDAEKRSERLMNILYQSFRNELCYIHLSAFYKPPPPPPHSKTKPAYPKGMVQRNAGLSFVRRLYSEQPHLNTSQSVMYFADDDNAYHFRLFQLLPTIKTIAFWAVGFIAGGQVERPEIDQHGKIIGWYSLWERGKKRKYQADMAGFAFNTQLLLDGNASFIFSESKLFGFSENQFLEALNFSLDDAVTFGISSQTVLAWHVKTDIPQSHRPKTPKGHMLGEPDKFGWEA